jgi:hypothetical protein
MALVGCCSTFGANPFLDRGVVSQDFRGDRRSGWLIFLTFLISFARHLCDI